MKIFYYSSDERIRCANCNSVQVKGMAYQPKNYPFRSSYRFFTSRKHFNELKFVHENGYSCKKCGHEFLALPKSFQNDYGSEFKYSPKKKGGCLATLMKLFLLIFIVSVLLAIFGKENRNSSADYNQIDDAVKSEQ